MKTKIKSLVCFILAIIMVASLSACAGASVPASIDDEGAFVYAITRAFEATSEAELAAKELRLKLKETFDCKITIRKDAAIEDYDDNYEILVGDNRVILNGEIIFNYLCDVVAEGLILVALFNVALFLCGFCQLSGSGCLVIVTGLEPLGHVDSGIGNEFDLCCQ